MLCESISENGFMMQSHLQGRGYSNSSTIRCYHAWNAVMMKAIPAFCSASLSLCYTATCYGMISALVPVGACGIASVRIPPFISQPNQSRSSGGGLCWFAGLLLSSVLQHNGLQDMNKQVLTCWWYSLILIGFPIWMYVVDSKSQPWKPNGT